MFGRKKDSASITAKDPAFEARYLGNVETFTSNGKGCAIIPVRNIWENSQSERHLKQVTVLVSSTGLTVKESKKDEGKKFSIENITFCNADITTNERIFCWIWKVPGIKKLECHAVLCRSRETAHALALVLSRAFQIAYKDWRANKDKQTRRRKNSLLQEKHTIEAVPEEGKTPAGTSNGHVPVSEVDRAQPPIHQGEGGEENGSVVAQQRRASAGSCMSGFASSVILDPDDEEVMQSDERVQAIVSEVEVTDSDRL